MAACPRCLALLEGRVKAAAKVHAHLVAIGDHARVHALFEPTLRREGHLKGVPSLRGGGWRSTLLKGAMKAVWERMQPTVLRVVRVFARVGVAIVSFQALTVIGHLLDKLHKLVQLHQRAGVPQDILAKSANAKFLLSNAYVMAGGIFTFGSASAAGSIARMLMETMNISVETEAAFSWQRLTVHLVRALTGLASILFVTQLGSLHIAVALLMVAVFFFMEVFQVLHKKLNELPTTLLMFAGAVGMALLTFLRYRFVWWPVHPVGLAVAYSGMTKHAAFCIFLTWICKAIILKVGGVFLYRRTVPFFIGIIVGYALSVAVGYFVDIVYYQGHGHGMHAY